MLRSGILAGMVLVACELHAPLAARQLVQPAQNPEAKLATAIEAARLHVDFSRPAILVAKEDAKDTVHVEFHRPTSGKIEDAGRKPSRKFLTVEITGCRIAVRPEAGQDASSSTEAVPVEAVRKARAAAVVVGHLQAKGRLAPEIEVSVREDDKGYSVLVWRIPYTPGGHTVVLVDPDFAVRRVIPGR